MSAEENKVIVRRLYEGMLIYGNLDIVDELLAPDHIDHDTASPTGVYVGRDHVKSSFAAYRAAFSNLEFGIEDMIAEGDRVVTRWVAHGTHTAPLLGIAPTGRQVTLVGIWIDRLVEGRIVENWDGFDRLGMLQQLGVVPL